jgi:transposase
MDHYVGIDVSLELSSLCVLDATGRLVREAKVASEPEALIGFLTGLALPLARIGLEAGPLSQWLHAALVEAGFAAVLLETRHVKAALSAMIVKTDRRDARGIAQLLRMGWFRSVHCKSPPAQEVRALLVARKQLQAKMRDVELSLRGLLRGFGLKVGESSQRPVCHSGPHAGHRPHDAGAGGRGDAAGARGSSGRVLQAAPGHAGERAHG